MTKVIIFDYDGTLANTRKVLLEVYPYVANKYGFKILSEEELDELKSRPLRERFKRVEMPIAKLPAIIRETRSKCSEYMHLCEPYPGIPELLTALKEKDIFLGIISSNIEKNIRSFLVDHQIDFFNIIITTSGLFGKHTYLKKFMKKHDIQKEDLIYIGDEVRDIVSCKKTGVKVIAVTWGYDDISILKPQNPDFIVNNPQEILSLI